MSGAVGGNGTEAEVSVDLPRGLVPAWHESAVRSFIGHCHEEGRERESVGLFLLVPAGMSRAEGKPPAVAWQSIYHRLQNVEEGEWARMRFRIDPEEAQAAVEKAVAARGLFWDHMELWDREGDGFAAWNPVVGIGHSHPQGSTEPSLADRTAFAQLYAYASELGYGTRQVSANYLFSFGAFGQDALTELNFRGDVQRTTTGTFVHS